MRERVQKIMAARGLCSRRAAEAMIAQGRVRVNGRKIELGAQCEDTDTISVDGQRIPDRKERTVYYMLYKPRGYVTTVQDDCGRKTVMELTGDIQERVYPVGRLDKLSEGLLLMTNDGEAAKCLTHPAAEIEKEYQVTVLGDVEQALPLFEQGMTLDDGFTTEPAKVRVIKTFDEKTMLSITITQGHNRQIRRMCEQAGLTVRRLVRISQGKLKLGEMKPGECRPLTDKEQAYLIGLYDPEAAAKTSGGNSRDRRPIGKPIDRATGRLVENRPTPKGKFANSRNKKQGRSQ